MYKQAILRLKTKGLSLPTVGKHPMVLLTSVDAEDTHQATILTRLGFTSHQKTHYTKRDAPLCREGNLHPGPDGAVAPNANCSWSTSAPGTVMGVPV